MIKRILLISFFGSFLVSCASYLGKANRYVYFSQQTSETDLRIYDRFQQEVYVGKTVDSLLIPSFQGRSVKPEYTFVFSKMGYQPQSDTLHYSIEKAWYLNILTLNLRGFFIFDPITGAIWKPTKREFIVDLKQE